MLTSGQVPLEQLDQSAEDCWVLDLRGLGAPPG